jgi:hypothetical protein
MGCVDGGWVLEKNRAPTMAHRHAASAVVLTECDMQLVGFL